MRTQRNQTNGNGNGNAVAAVGFFAVVGGLLLAIWGATPK